MKSFDSELQYLNELYQRLEHEMTRVKVGEGQDDTDQLIGVILENRELFSRIDQMNGRVAQLVKEWEEFNSHLDPATRERTRAIAKSVAMRGDRLNRILGERSTKVESKRMRVASKLAELRKGSRFLQSVKPLKANYPKFIDSLG